MSDKIRRRYFELRYDADEREVSGVAIRYGDVAEFPWGEKERFEPGAFGDIAEVDAVMNVQHDRGRPIARTDGGGLDFVDSDEALRLTAKLADTGDARDAMELVRSKVLRGLSIEFRELDGQWDRANPETRIVREAELLGVAIVDRPAYPQSTIDARMREKASMDERVQELEARIAELEDERDAAISERDKAAEACEAAMSERDEAIQAREAMEAETAAKSVEAVDQALSDAKEHLQEVVDRATADIETKARERADLIVMCRELVPANYEFAGRSNKDIMVEACGEEVEGAAERSEDYLLAKLETIVERRAKAGDNRQRPAEVGPLARPMSGALMPR